MFAILKYSIICVTGSSLQNFSQSIVYSNAINVGKNKCNSVKYEI